MEGTTVEIDHPDYDDDVAQVESLRIVQVMNRGVTTEHIQLLNKLISRMLPCAPTDERAGMLVGLRMAVDVLRDAGTMWQAHYEQRIKQLELAMDHKYGVDWPKIASMPLPKEVQK